MTPLVFFCWASLQATHLYAQAAPEEAAWPAEEAVAPAEAAEAPLLEEMPSPPPSSSSPSPSSGMAHFHFKMGEGFSLSSGGEGEEEAFGLRVRAMAQLRNSTSFEGKASNEFSARGVRVLLEGRTLGRRLTFRVQMGLSPDEVDGGSGLLDAWVAWKFGRDATLRVGQQRVIYDMASAIVRDGYLGVTRENMTGEFGMSRDMGLSLFSEDFLGLGGLLAYRLGLYGGQGRNRFNFNRFGFLYMARITLRPFGYFDDTVEGDIERLARLRLAIGLSAAYGDNVARAGGHNGEAFESVAFSTLDAYSLNADFMLKWRGIYFAGQYSRRTFSKAFVENGSERVWARAGHGYVLKAGGMLTPQLELVGRWSQQFGLGQTDPALLAQPKNEFAVGLNAYFRGHALRVQAEYSARFSDAQVLFQNWLRLQLQVVF